MTRINKVISLEGIDGSGKSSVALWLKERLESLGFDVVLLSEPGSTPIGEMVRRFLLDGSQKSSSPWTDTLMFYTARVENIHRNIFPSLSGGRWVILDRFQDSTIAYQGYGQGLDIEKLEAIYRLVADGFMPDWTILLDCSPDVALKRLFSRSDTRTRWECMGKAFFERVRKGYLDLAKRYGDRISVVDGTESIVEVYEKIERLLIERFNRWGIQTSSNKQGR